MFETEGWVENKNDKEHFGVYYVSKNIKNADQPTLTNKGWQKKDEKKEMDFKRIFRQKLRKKY